jgi:hypothetical protein
VLDGVDAAAGAESCLPIYSRENPKTGGIVMQACISEHQDVTCLAIIPPPRMAVTSP